MFVVNVLQLTEADQALYKDFSYVNSERWQQEIAGTISFVFSLKTEDYLFLIITLTFILVLWNNI